MAPTVGIFRQTQKTLMENPMIWVLFFFLALCDLAALLILYTAPFGPHAVVLAPIIRTLWAERYLHYPENFLLLPKLVQHAHMVILLIVGITLTGIVIKKIEAFKKGETLHSVQALKYVLPRYLPMALCWGASYYGISFLAKKGLPLLPHNFWGYWAGTFVFAVFWQALFAYLLPGILLSRSGIFQGIRDAFVVGVKCMMQTMALIAVPVLVMVGLAYAKGLAPFWVRSDPERVLWVLVLAIPIYTLADLWITVSTTLLFLKAKGNQKSESMESSKKNREIDA